MRIETMTPAEKRAYVIADNKLALNAGWDEEILAEELQGACWPIDLDFDIGVTGFSIPEIDSLIEGLNPEEPGDPEDDHAARPDGPAALPARRLWQLGPHRLICGNALDPRPSPTLHGRRAGADGLHRPALQRADRRAMSAARARSSTASSPWPPAR